MGEDESMGGSGQSNVIYIILQVVIRRSSLRFTGEFSISSTARCTRCPARPLKSTALTETNYRNLVEIICSLPTSNGGKCARYCRRDAQQRTSGTLWYLSLIYVSGHSIFITESSGRTKQIFYR